MEVEGVYYIAQVKQKKQAWKMYKEAVERNQTAGHIDVEVRSKVGWPHTDSDPPLGETQQQVPSECQHGGQHSGQVLPGKYIERDHHVSPHLFHIAKFFFANFVTCVK